MFKNKALYVQMVNPNNHQPAVYAQPATVEETTPVPPWITQAINEEVVTIVKAVVVVLAVNAGLTTVSKILINRLSK